ncbi:hypothetical protein [Allochromatium vinosum]|uniref:Uncharacterized protein n=1 Tax=Allochromatium vinosum (strain ATCC 17899 / DSM 180 / NBRC 103801 / NCIMB 10441 / D) TaxID=572477 RepID=D3RWA5_ALLVD|nr:hypothetical protein [Allochromatium vinosum]ADC64117.1 hypothetical protein Alvin_3225 [Allochromatium vinosum DSM 180]
MIAEIDSLVLEHLRHIHARVDQIAEDAVPIATHAYKVFLTAIAQCCNAPTAIPLNTKGGGGRETGGLTALRAVRCPSPSFRTGFLAQD